jgi:alkyl sulfatase BDS1-like metallo-beta-lactamase superfamily hydrolase
MPELQIMADAGNVAMDMGQFKFLDREDPFDGMHPSLHRIGRLNLNYGLYEVRNFRQLLRSEAASERAL